MAEQKHVKITQVTDEETLRAKLKEKGISEETIEKIINDSSKLKDRTYKMINFLSSITDTTFDGIDTALTTITPLALDLADLSLSTKGFVEHCQNNITDCLNMGMTPFDIIASHLMTASILVSMIRSLLYEHEDDKDEKDGKSKTTEEILDALKGLSKEDKAKIIASLMK